MKTIVVLFLLISLVSGTSLQTGLLNPLQLSIGEESSFAHHHVQKRQSFSNLTAQDEIDCAARIFEYWCSSGYAQRFVDISLSCRNETAARLNSRSCARNERGQACAAATRSFLVNQTQVANGRQCIGAVSSGSCPANCHSHLQTARSKLGCCINTYFNTTECPLYARYSYLADYRLWDLCNVDLPPADCGNALPLNPPVDAQTCTVEEYYARLANYQCMPNVTQPLFDAVLQNPVCRIYTEMFADVCETNANGKYCAEALGIDFISTLVTFSPLLQHLGRQCGTVNSTCTPSCQTALTVAKEAHGCCINVFNNSDIDLHFPFLSYGVWSLCEVETPGFCSINSSRATKTVYVWIIAAAVMIVSLMI